ncbi:MAG: UDP-N-acetylmuramoyl-L-alanyl-D-glutamate--2,6-diaminopimelate ligase, partial [Nocardioidaceae bacterium]|nr:UDP-N-acetylmuramoyl-L-alanyl-D-glutamate--2,6-diaminopimelate ligase [Nocardioidaceae bacterium]
MPTRPGHPLVTSLTAVLGTLGARLLEVRGEAGHVEVTGLTISSRRVLPGDLYAAPAGAHAHGATFAVQAVEAGAVAVLTDPAGGEMCASLDVPVVVVHRPREVLGMLAAQVYGNPAEQLRLLAVTGTQGKTTTTRLAEGALTTSGVPAAVVGTVGTRVNGMEVTSSLTTPEAPDLHALFAVMV